MAIPFLGTASANFLPGRPAGFMPDAIVLHRTGGTRGAIRARFHDPRTSVSAHYLVGLDGRVEQFVREEDVAFHAGTIVAPSWPRLRPNVNPNHYTVGIELEGDGGSAVPPPQLDGLAALVAEIAARWGFPVAASHVIPHSAIRASTSCPGGGFPIDAVLARAVAAAPALRAPSQRLVRTLSTARLRRGAPSVRAEIARLVPPQTTLVATAFTGAGDVVEGNPFWYALEEDEFVWAGATDAPSPRGDGAIADPGTTDTMEAEAQPATGLGAGPATGAGFGIPIDRETMVLPAKEFHGTVTPKDLVVLHFTAGTTARSAFDTWRQRPERVATSYLVDVDGTVYEVFPPRFWAAHLGVKATNNVHDRRSIGIEIANVGPLQPSSEDARVLNWWPKKSPSASDFTTRFCNVDERHRYVEATYRGMAHFAAFPDVQVDAVAALVRGLCTQFGIVPTLPPLARRFDDDLASFATYKGVCSHANFRRDKWDIGPAFPWDRLGL